MKRSKSEIIFSIFNYLFLAMAAFATLYPFMYALSMSLSTTKEAARAGFHLYPREVSVMAYKMVFQNELLYTSYMNTIIRTVLGTFLALLVTGMYAYALSRKTMPHRKFFMYIALFTMLFSGGAIPSYLVIKQYNLLDNRLIYILPSAIVAYNMIVARSFFQSIPESMHESGKMDGASEFKIFFRIILPLSKPIIMTLMLWIAAQHWNAWYDSVIYITDNKKIVLQDFLQRIIQENNDSIIAQAEMNPDLTQYTPDTIKFATIIVSIIPMLIFYPFIQKYFVKGVMLGAIKG